MDDEAMSLHNRPERYDLDGATRSADALYPHVMAAIRHKYPDYSIIWDRWRERWVLVRIMGPEKIEPLSVIENDDTTYAEPSMALIEKLHISDWINFYPDHETFIRALERRESDFEARWSEQKNAEWQRVSDAIAGHFERDPSSVNIVLKPYRADHKKQIVDAMRSRKEAAA
jgi:hypothetical protein